jgi:hypothetical protein
MYSVGVAGADESLAGNFFEKLAAVMIVQRLL